MATWYAQNSSVNIDSVNQWNSAPNGSGSWLTWASLDPSDILVANGKTGIAINVSFTCALITTNATGGTTGGRFTVSSTVTITANVTAGATYQSNCLDVNNSSPSVVTILGNVTGGSGAEAMTIGKTGSGTLNVIGLVSGGTGGNSWCISMGSGVLNITGAVSGGSGTTSPGVYCSGGTTSVTGNVSGGSNGDATGIITAGGTTIVTGDATGGSNATAYAMRGSGAVLNGSAIASLTTPALLLPMRVNGGLIAASNGTAPITGVGSLLIGSSSLQSHTYRTDSSGSVGAARTLTTSGANQAATADVRLGTSYGGGTGTLAVPSPTLVAIGVATDNTVGSYNPSVNASDIRAAIGLASANLDTQLTGIQSDTNDIHTRLPAALESGRMPAVLSPATETKIDQTLAYAQGLNDQTGVAY
jgi:hypothetical protein